MARPNKYEVLPFLPIGAFNGMPQCVKGVNPFPAAQVEHSLTGIGRSAPTRVAEGLESTQVPDEPASRWERARETGRFADATSEEGK